MRIIHIYPYMHTDKTHACMHAYINKRTYIRKHNIYVRK